jgi:serine O-acetyltransferase
MYGRTLFARTKTEGIVEIDNEIEQIAAELLNDFQKRRDVAAKQPVKAVIVDIIGKMQHLLFPGIFESVLTDGSVKNRLNVMLEEISHDLAKQTRLALRYDARYKDAEHDELDKVAWEITRRLILKIPLIKDFLEKDIEAAYSGDPAAYSKAEIVLSYPGIYATMVYRIAHELYLLSVPLIPRIMSEYAHSVTGIDIHPGAAIGKYFFIDHGTGIVIGETAVIGDNVKLYQGVTLGALSTKGGQSIKGVKRHPTLSDNVTVYSGASILGGDTIIGEGVVVGGNAFVIRSVPEKTRVSVKNPELQFKSASNISTHIELDQMDFWHYEI